MCTLRLTLITLVGAVGFSTIALAQHADILVQSASDRLINGTGDPDNEVYVLDTRTYARDFDSNYSVNEPGWNSVGVGNPDMPVGAEALPANTGLEFDFLPMKVDGYTSNFLYWDGVGSVDFGATPTANYLFALETFSSGLVIIDGSPVLEPGAVFENTDHLGAIHKHRDWEMDDGVSGTNPVDGIYLVALRTRMNTLDRSKPFYVIFGTLGSTTAARNAAEAWVDDRVDDLSPDYSADFDGDLDVDSDDLAIWSASYTTTGDSALQVNGDANYNTVVDGLDFLKWQTQAGSNVSTFAGASTAPLAAIAVVPEPCIMGLIAAAFVCRLRSRRKS